MVTEEEREVSYWRQAGIFIPPEYAKVTIIGAGGIGSWVALGLYKTGFEKIEVWDGDIVEAHNIPNQVYEKNGGFKVERLKETVPVITPVCKFWDGDPLVSDVIVIAVDNMDTRKRIVETQRAGLIIDGRIGGEFIRVLSVSPLDYFSKQYYLETWYPSSEAVELPCTARSIADVGFFVAGIICNLIRKYYKEQKIIREIMFDVNLLDMIKIEKEI